ncbi:hypothetical protein F4703DRAFT_1414194 [Phycomyces blakesleeanus]
MKEKIYKYENENNCLLACLFVCFLMISKSTLRSSFSFYLFLYDALTALQFEHGVEWSASHRDLRFLQKSQLRLARVRLSGCDKSEGVGVGGLICSCGVYCWKLFIYMETQRTL